MYKCSKLTSKVTVEFLHKFFAWYGVLDITISDNSTQFTVNEFKNVCKVYSSEHITTPPYHPRLNGQAERLVDTCKRALKKSRSELVIEAVLTQFLRVYRITLNPNTFFLSSKSHVQKNIVKFWQTIKKDK